MGTGHEHLPNTEHVALPDDNWADLRLGLTHGQAQEVETAQLLADYDVRGELNLTRALIRSALSATPQEWATEHMESTMRSIGFALDNYEATMEGAVAAPERRRQMASATLALQETFARVYTAAWSFGPDPADAASWPTIDGRAVRIISRRARQMWNRWQREMRARLKDDGNEQTETGD